jgi:hypothetical protein
MKFLPFPALSIQANVFAVVSLFVFAYDGLTGSYKSFVTKTPNPNAILLSGFKAMFIGGWIVLVNTVARKNPTVAWVLVVLPLLAAFIAR